MDTQSVLSSIDQLLSLNGWVAAACPTLTRPFGQNKHEDAYDDLAQKDHLYYVGIVIHSADHFLVDQLAVIVQMAKRLNGFKSLCEHDQLVLIKYASIEIVVLRMILYFDFNELCWSFNIVCICC